MSNNKENKYYVYAWYYKNTGEIFHIGKGCYGRWKDTKHRRNEYFKNIIAKEKDNVDVRKIVENLYQEEAWELERYFIKFYKSFGWCKTNFHEGGRGGNHGNYGENMRKKLSDYRKTMTGDKNYMFGKTHTKEAREKISKAAKEYHKTHPLTKEHLDKMQEGLRRVCATKEWREKMSKILKGRKMTPEQREANQLRQCHDNWIIKNNDQIIFESRIRREAIKFCETELKFSRTIFFQILKGDWKPKFNKHQHLKNIKIIQEKNKFIKGVSTNPDECKGVE